jgi:AcrR family transcriptional regulator
VGDRRPGEYIDIDDVVRELCEHVVQGVSEDRSVVRVAGLAGHNGDSDCPGEIDEPHRVLREACESVGDIIGEDRDPLVVSAAVHPPGAIYLFFDSKQHLVAETLIRRGDELIAVLNAAAEGGSAPVLKLHHIVDLTVAFFEARPHFRRLLRQLAGGTPIVGPALGTYGSNRNAGFTAAMTAIGGIVADGQAAGEIREGDTYAITHLYSVLINEHILLATEMSSGRLTAAQFHDLVDGMLRRPNL